MDVKESHVLRQVLDYLAAERKFAIRLNTGAFFLRGSHARAFRSHNLGPGVADILIVPPGATWLECKGPNGRQRSEQKQFEQWVIGWGHRYILTRSVDDLVGIV